MAAVAADIQLRQLAVAFFGSSSRWWRGCERRGCQDGASTPPRSAAKLMAAHSLLRAGADALRKLGAKLVARPDEFPLVNNDGL